MNKDDAVRIAVEILQQLAADRLRPLDATLYSQHSRLRHGQRGLSSWQANSAEGRLHDAAQLLHAGLLLRSAGADGWRSCVRRGGELLEWLSHPRMQLGDVPTRLLSAAAYSLAGFPARADALLRDPGATSESQILRAYLRGDYPGTFELIRRYWEAQPPNAGADDGQANRLSGWVVQESIRALGVICASLRWSDEFRRDAALEKLDAVASLLTIERDPYSWLLARLTTECARETFSHAWRTALAPLRIGMTAAGNEVLDRYARLCFLLKRAVAWPSQEDGIQRLRAPGSFALCTPTGSGKTSVAEVAILQAILNGSAAVSAPLCLYLVPSRALAAEVEGKLHRVLQRLTYQRVVVTGLYGGTDWGPTDAWLTADDPTVLICTYEKGEALIRFLGPLFLGRLTLVVFDEAHMVQFDQNVASLRAAESRCFRLESLAVRIRELIGSAPCRMIALSAVAAGLEDALHQWVGGDRDGHAVLTGYRSTRQLIGRMECQVGGPFTIRYDILDGHSLIFSGNSDATPFVPSPIPPCPPGPTGSAWRGVEKGLRPALLWAALHLAARDDQGAHHAVLISVPQRIAGYAKDFLEILERTWSARQLPSVLGEIGTPEQQLVWDRTLAVCDDYFGPRSYEARLLRRGIVVHHSSMPKLLTRLLIEVIQAGLANVILATSTLSEGVNIPVETILVPSLLRGSAIMRTAEFRNLAGRAGRPGVATEGRTLVLLPPGQNTSYYRYRDMVNSLLVAAQPEVPRSPIIAAINDVWQQWQQLTKTTDEAAFLQWLETVSLTSLSIQDFGSLDALDGMLLSGMVEHEEIRLLNAWEASLQELWNGAFNSHRASEREHQAFLHRGRAIPVVYPDRNARRQLYRTGLPPTSARELLALLPEIRTVMEAGTAYGAWSPQQRVAFIGDVIAATARISRFRPEADEPDWRAILSWWLQIPGAQEPAENEIAQWHKNVSTWFTYRFCWGLGSIVGVAFDAVHGGQLAATSLDQWELTGLPWIVFWMKELLSWGTPDPATAFLLGRGLAFTRHDAQVAAASYPTSAFAQEAVDPLDPRAIRSWAEATFGIENTPGERTGPRRIAVDIADATVNAIDHTLSVLPAKEPGGVAWVDAAGFLLARTPNMPWEWADSDVPAIDFRLLPQESVVTAQPYL